MAHCPTVGLKPVGLFIASSSTNWLEWQKSDPSFSTNSDHLG